ncbi:MAG: winged helix-turn-helix domain-containing protein [Methanobacteriota archaeon]
MSKNLEASDAEQASKLVRASAHPARLKAMAMLADGAKEFGDLQDRVGLSKTALANHLSQMVGMGLVERRGRGSYSLTEDGAQLLEAIGGFYAGSRARVAAEQKNLASMYSKGREKGIIGVERLVSNEPVYQCCWLSYTGAISGALKSIGIDRDVVDVAGYTGYAFVLNVSKGATCPSGPTCLGYWDDIEKATEVLGRKVTSYTETKCFPQAPGPLSAEDQTRARKLFEVVKKEIDRDMPVVLWGIPIPEYGIVKGYRGDEYLVSTFRANSGMPDDPVRYDALVAPGCLQAFMFGSETRGIDAKADRKAVERAVEIAGGARKWAGYEAGPVAYDEWANVLEKGIAGEAAYHGHSYVTACYHEGRKNAAEFLRRLAMKYSAKPQSKHLANAAKEYGEAAELMGKLEKCFPFAFDGALPQDKCKKGAALLRAARPYEEAAISHMRNALGAWK